MTINQRLKNLRTDKDLTQKQVANALYMQVTQYRRYEIGERSLPIDIAVSLSKFFNVSLDYLACLTDFDNNISADKLSKEEKMFLTKYNRLSQADKIRIDERIDTLLELQSK